MDRIWSTRTPAALIENVARTAHRDIPPLDARQMLVGYRTIPEHVRGVWKELAEIVTAEDRGAELHAARDDFEEYVAGLTRAMKDAVQLGKIMIVMGHPVEPLVEDLVHGLTDLESFRHEVFDHWHTEDDLCDVMSDLFALSAEQLQSLAKRYPPPQSWYEATDNPFAPAPAPE